HSAFPSASGRECSGRDDNLARTPLTRGRSRGDNLGRTPLTEVERSAGETPAGQPPGRRRYCSLLQFWALARVHDLGWVDRIFVYLLFENLPIFSDEEIDPAGGFVLVQVDAVLVGGFSAPVTQQREGHSNLVGEGFVGERAIHAHTQDLGVGRFQLLQVLLEVFHLLGSTSGEGEDVKGQHDVLLAAILAQGNVFQAVSVK